MCFPFWNQFLLVLETRMCVIQYSYNIQYEANLIGQLTKNGSVFHLLLHASMILTPDNKWFHWNLWFWVTPRQQHLVNHNLHTGPRQLNLVGISESHPFHPTVFFLILLPPNCFFYWLYSFKLIRFSPRLNCFYSFRWSSATYILLPGASISISNFECQNCNHTGLHVNKEKLA